MATQLRGVTPFASTGANSLISMAITDFSYYLSQQQVNQPAWVQLYAPAANADTVVIGGLDNDGTKGIPIFPGGALMIPAPDKVYCAIGVNS